MVEKGRPTRGNPARAPEPKSKLLCLDGAGVYGLMTAIWLRKLAERDPTFLADMRPVSFESWPECNVIAGASSGAVNALLL
ncbi:MAG TPA: hypothetical protein VK420_08420, partial [Longimicrobium sp.]|nr:hypothetical protein [Longimicrobium sp.]